jgi:hypothetical protein
MKRATLREGPSFPPTQDDCCNRVENAQWRDFRTRYDRAPDCNVESGAALFFYGAVVLCLIHSELHSLPSAIPRSAPDISNPNGFAVAATVGDIRWRGA